jgi:hypothetical protein
MVANLGDTHIEPHIIEINISIAFSGIRAVSTTGED